MTTTTRTTPPATSTPRSPAADEVRLAFSVLLHDLATNPDSVPEYDSLLCQLLKEKLGSNSHLVAYHTLRS